MDRRQTVGKQKFRPPVELKLFKIFQTKTGLSDYIIGPTTTPIFVEIGPKGSTPKIAEI